MAQIVKTFLFTKECHITSRKERAKYRIEIDQQHRAYFYTTGLLTNSFHIDIIDNIDDDSHLRTYLKILLRSVVMIQEN